MKPMNVLNKMLLCFAIIVFLFSCQSEQQPEEVAVEQEEKEVAEEEPKKDQSFFAVTDEFLADLGIEGGIRDSIKAYGDQFKDIEKLKNIKDSLGGLLGDMEVPEGQKSTSEMIAEGKKRRAMTDMDDLEEAFYKLNSPEEVGQKIIEIDEATSGSITKMKGLLSEEEFEDLLAAAKNEATTAVTKSEQQILDVLNNASTNPHSSADLAKYEETVAKMDIEKMQKDGLVTENFAKAFKREVRMGKSRINSKTEKATAAEQKFKSDNPDLYFEDGIGMTYFSGKKAVFLPMGKLSFVDEIIDFYHPKVINQTENVKGEPDAIDHGSNDLEGAHSLGRKGSLTIRFTNNALVDVNGPDLFVFEVGEIEPTKLEISKDGENWIDVGKIKGGVAQVDIQAFVQPNELFYYVRLTDLVTDSAIPGADIDAIAAIGSALRLNLDSKVLFDTGKAELKPEGIESLKELVPSIEILKQGTITVEGHTDDVGTEVNNQKLSLARAKSVSAELKKLIPSKKFQWKESGLGESKPLVPNDSEENRAKNRRVEILVLSN